ncbi:hypothetical protein HZ994_10620 [Akkermansiaceae bacterium]|nr:hypothetical protein HZ994_10620 [Akkermansiaceae bacterium]
MLPETNPLIAAATAPFADNAEQRMAVTGMLRETADPAHPDAAAAIVRWEEMDARKHPGAWKVILYALAAISLAALVITGISAFKTMRMVRALTSFAPIGEGISPEGLSASGKLLLGDPSKPRITQKEALHNSDPERPDFYAEYADAYFEFHDAFPAHHLQTVARIDPENAFFPYIMAGRQGGDSIEKVKSPPSGPSPPPRMRDGVRLRPIPKETVWKITDEAEFAEAMEWIAKASALPRFDSYETALAEKRVGLFDQETFVGRMQALTYSASQTSQVISLMKAANLLQASAYLHSVDGDAEAFRRDHEMAEALLAHLGKSPPGTLVGELVFNAIAIATTQSLYHGAVRLGISDLEESLGKRKAAFQEYSDLKEIRRNDATTLLIEAEGSMMHRLSLPLIGRQVANPPVLTSNDLAPSRLAEHDFASALGVSALAASALVCGLCVFLFQYRAPRAIRVLSDRFTQLLNGCDWIWIFGIGVVLPFMVTFAISLLTPLGGRGMGLSRMGFQFPAIHYTILLLLILGVTPILVRWRLGKRSGAFGMDFRIGKPAFVFPVMGIVLALAAYPLLAGNIHKGRNTLILLGAPLLLWQLSIVVTALRALFGKQASRLRRAIVARVMQPAFALALIIPAVALPLFLASAEKRFTEDDLTRVAARGFSSYEAEIANLKRQEVNTILGIEN